MTIRFTGIDDCCAALDALSQRAAAGGRSALDPGIKHIAQVAADRAPKDSGDLASSAKTEIDGDTASVTFTAPYARFQELITHLHHEGGGQALYLTSTVKTETGEATRIVGDGVKEAL